MTTDAVPTAGEQYAIAELMVARAQAVLDKATLHRDHLEGLASLHRVRLPTPSTSARPVSAAREASPARITLWEMQKAGGLR